MTRKVFRLLGAALLVSGGLPQVAGAGTAEALPVAIARQLPPGY